MPDTACDDIYALVKSVRNKVIPGSEAIVRAAFEELGLTAASAMNPKGKTQADVMAHFDLYLNSAFTKALEVLEKYESEVYPMVLRKLAECRADALKELEAKTSGKTFPFKVGESLALLYPDLWEVMLSRSQSRKQRGGKDFEEQLGQLLTLGGIKYSKQIRKFHTDFVIPSQTFFNQDRTRSMLVSAKRTLRERWQNVVNEIEETHCPNAYLCTTEESVTQPLIERLRPKNIHLVVWDRVKAGRFATEPLVIGYSQLANRDIPTFRPYWPP